MQTLTKLDQMAVKAKDIAGDRAARAVDVYMSGGLVFQEYHNDTDVWQYRSFDHEPYTVSHRGQTCTCPDYNAPRPDRLGKLCKHRIAVMYAIRLRDDGLAELAAMLRDATGATLRLTVHYGAPSQYWLEAIRIHGQRELILEHPSQMGDGWHRFQFDPTDLAGALDKVGWGVTSNTKQRGMTHTLTLAPGIDRADSLNVMRSVAGNAQADIEQRKLFAEMATVSDLVMA